MGHSIYGFIAGYRPLAAAAADLPGARVCRLGLGFGFLPLTEDIASGEDPAADYEYLYRLTAPTAAWAVEQSRTFPIAYIQTDYHGGVGSQCGVVWRDGAIVFGPVETVDSYDEATLLLEGAINRAVRLLGAERGGARDEFEALGLNLYRSNEDWVEAAGREIQALGAEAYYRAYGFRVDGRRRKDQTVYKEMRDLYGIDFTRFHEIKDAADRREERPTGAADGHGDS